MNEELERTLILKYPKIFSSKSFYYFEHSDGWFDIIDVACSNIQNHVDWKRKNSDPEILDEEWEEGHQVVAVQSKEKFGGLRFYVNNCDEYVRGVIEMTESMSYRTCEYCGLKGQRRSGPWIKTLCDNCYRKP
jgi:hypothetical protein